jgi:hypothetical protein
VSRPLEKPRQSWGDLPDKRHEFRGHPGRPATASRACGRNTYAVLAGWGMTQPMFSSWRQVAPSLTNIAHLPRGWHALFPQDRVRTGARLWFVWHGLLASRGEVPRTLEADTSPNAYCSNSLPARLTSKPYHTVACSRYPGSACGLNTYFTGVLAVLA